MGFALIRSSIYSRGPWCSSRSINSMQSIEFRWTASIFYSPAHSLSLHANDDSYDYIGTPPRLRSKPRLILVWSRWIAACRHGALYGWMVPVLEWIDRLLSAKFPIEISQVIWLVIKRGVMQPRVVHRRKWRKLKAWNRIPFQSRGMFCPDEETFQIYKLVV